MVKAIEAGNVTYVKNWLSKKTTQINQQFSDGSTVLHRAAAWCMVVLPLLKFY